MRRSSSSTNIPLPKIDRNRQRSLTRVSARERPGSLDRLQVPRSTDLLYSLKKTTPKVSTLNSASKTGLKKSTTPLRSYGFRKSSVSATPSSVRSRSKSPRQERFVNNPKWVAQEFAKVRSFLELHPDCPENVPASLKPPTINSFIVVMNLLLKEINPNIKITNVNYKEVVLESLKMLNYPGNISNSMLKTVGAMHTWPHVISVFAWLVDLVIALTQVDPVAAVDWQEDIKDRKLECVVDYSARRYLLYNSESNPEAEAELDEDFAKTMDHLLNIDEEHDKQLTKEVATLSALRDDQLKQLAEQESHNDAMQKEIDQLHNERECFYLHKDEKQGNLYDEKDYLISRRNVLVAKIQEKQNNIPLLRETIKNQPCTIQEKKNILKRIEEISHTIQLKRDKIKTAQFIKTDCDVKKMETRKKIEKAVYQLNNDLMSLIVFEQQLKSLEINETDLISEELLKHIENVFEKLQIFEVQYAQELASKKSQLSRINTDMSNIQQQVNTVEKDNQRRIQLEMSINTKIQQQCCEMETISNERQTSSQAFSQKMKDLKESRSALAASKERYHRIHLLKKEKQGKFETLQFEFLEFFSKLHDNVMGNLGDMIDIRNHLYGVLTSCLKEIVPIQNEIIEDLKELEHCRED